MVALSFDRLCATFNVTAGERDALAWHLAMFRARRTYDRLRSPNVDYAAIDRELRNNRRLSRTEGQG